MWNFEVAGISLYYILNWFFIYSFLGWLWESCFVSIKSGEVVNRGFINGPFCTIYGCGALGVYLILKSFDNNVVLLYAGGVIVATVLEYLTGWLMETIFHTRWWDYSKHRFHLHGRICLECSLGWGIFTVLLFKVLHPMVEWIVALYSISIGKILVIVVGIYYIADFSSSIVAACGLSKKFSRIESIIDEIEIFLQTTKLYETKEEIRERLEESKKVLSYKKLKNRLEERKTVLLKRLEEGYQQADVSFAGKKAEIEQRYDELASKYADFRKKQNPVSKRMMNAYPNLNEGFKRYQEKIMHKLKNKNH